MNIMKLGRNQTILTTNHGWVILYHYDTPVAGYNPILNVYFRTSKKGTITASKHINKWLNGAKAIEMSQEDIDNIGFLIGE